MINKRLKTLNSNKNPKNKLPHIGVELECGFKTEENLKQFKLLVVSDTNLYKKINIGTDGSIDDIEFPIEIRLLTTEIEYKNDIISLCKYLNDSNVIFNDSCGLHVHLDFRYWNYYQAISNFYRNQNLLYNLCPNSRRNNDYCAKMSPVFPQNDNDISNYINDAYENLNFEPHYHGINIENLLKSRKTIEIRMAAASTNPKKIISWIRLLLAIRGPLIKTKNIKPSNEMKTDIKYLKSLNLENDIFSYLKSRYYKLNKKKGK